MEKAKITVEGYEMIQLEVDSEGVITMPYDDWCGKKIVVIKTEI